LSVTDNIVVAQQLVGRADRERVAALLASVGLTARAHARPSQLSGGETARAGLAVAVANAPAVVLAGERTGELARGNAGIVLDLLAGLTESGSAVVVVTHNEELAERADRTFTLRDGRMAACSRARACCRPSTPKRTSRCRWSSAAPIPRWPPRRPGSRWRGSASTTSPARCPKSSPVDRRSERPSHACSRHGPD